MGVAVEPDDELNRTVAGVTTAAAAGDPSFPVGPFVVKAAQGLPPLGDRRPGLVRTGHLGDEATCRNRDLAVLRGFSLGHTETAGLFGCCWKIRGNLGVGFERGRQQEAI